MKHFFLVLSFLVFTVIGNSQLNKGTWLVGGSGKFYSYNDVYTNANPAFNGTAKSTDLELNANIGFFLAEKFVLGAKPSFSSFKVTGTSSGVGSSTTRKIFIGPFARYYFLEKEKQFNILSELSYQFGVNDRVERKGKINNLSIMAGPELFFNSSVGLEILLGYTMQKETIDDAQSGYTDTKKGFQVAIGFQIHLQKL